MIASTIEIPELLDHQTGPGEAPQRFKVFPWGRRAGKTTMAENISVLGHGPVTDGRPLRLGLMHGRDVVWMAPTIPQASIMWETDVSPRFRGRHDLIRVDEQKKLVQFLNPDGTPYSTLWVRSAEAAASVRGIGKKLGGVVVDEAAHMDLELVWRSVLRPALMDCGGWAVICSTTNAGPDGHKTANGLRTPSFFNILCDQIEAGERNPRDWGMWERTAADNPLIAPQEFQDLIREYPADSPDLAQEVYAKRIAAGAGIAFAEFDRGVHVAAMQPEQQPDNWRWAGGLDWGYSPDWGCFVLCAFGTDQRAIARFEVYWQKLAPAKAGYYVGKQLMASELPMPEYIASDSSMFSVTVGARTIASEFQRGLNRALKGLASSLIPAPKGAGSRAARKQLLHQYLAVEEVQPGKERQPWQMPRLRFHPQCKTLIRTLPRLPLDPKKPNDVDTRAEDHAYDALTYLLITYTPEVEREIKGYDPDVHPGMVRRNDEWVRRPREKAPWERMAEERITGDRFRRFRSREKN